MSTGGLLGRTDCTSDSLLLANKHKQETRTVKRWREGCQQQLTWRTSQKIDDNSNQQQGIEVTGREKTMLMVGMIVVTLCEAHCAIMSSSEMVPLLCPVNYNLLDVFSFS